jgi:hypothetical protein
VIGHRRARSSGPVSTFTACATIESACTCNPTLVPLKLTGVLLICNFRSTDASVHPPSATQVRLQRKAFDLKSPPYQKRPEQSS